MAIRRADGFGEYLRHCRLAAGMTQEELAEGARLSVRGISDMERGVVRLPYRRTLESLADGLALTGATRDAFLSWQRRDVAPSPSAAAEPLVGRDSETCLLAEHLAGEGPPVLLLAGEPGIGKSRLLRHAATSARQRGMTVLAAGCRRRSGEEPYAPLTNALADFAESQSPRRLRSLLDGAGWLTRLLPELEEIGVPTPVGNLAPAQEQRLMVRAVHHFLRNIAAPSGLALLLDDLQWAGPNALDLLVDIAREAGDAGLRIVGAYRDTEITRGGPLSTVLADLAGASLASYLALRPLDHHASRALLHEIEGRLTPEAVESIASRCGGLPYFLVSSAQATNAPGAVSWTLAQSVRQRVAALPLEVRPVLEAASILGRHVSLDLLAALLDMPRSAIASALDVTCEARLLIESAPRQYAFAHDVVREVIEEDLGSATRALMHVRAAEALEGAATSGRRVLLGEIAWHYVEGRDARRAVPALMSAGRQAEEMLAIADAKRAYGQAAREATAAGDEVAEAAAQERAAAMAEVLNHYDDAIDALEKAAAIYRRRGDYTAEARSLARLGFSHFFRMTWSHVAPRIEELAARLETEAPSAELAWLYVALALFWYGERPNDALRAATAARDIANKIGDDHLFVEAEERRGLALGRVGRWEEGLGVLLDAVPVAEAAGEHQAAAHMTGFAAIASGMLGRPARALELWESAISAVERMDDTMSVVYGLTGSVPCRKMLGDWAGARTACDRALDLVRHSRLTTFSAQAPLQACILAVHEGRWDDAEALAQETRTMSHDQPNDRPDNLLVSTLAEMELLRHGPQAAYERLAPHLDGFYCREPATTSPPAAPIEICTLAGQIDQAKELARGLEALLVASGNRRQLAPLRRVQALIALQQGQLDEAARLCTDALERSLAMPWRLEEARARALHARIAAARGQAAIAEAQRARARDLFMALGASAFVSSTAMTSMKS